MTLVVDIPEELREWAQAAAAARGETLEHLASTKFARWLAAYLDELREQEDDDRAIDEFEARVALGEERLTPWEEVEAELDALPD